MNGVKPQPPVGLPLPHVRLDPEAITAAVVRACCRRHRLTLDHAGGWFTEVHGRRLCCPATALAIDCRPGLAVEGWAGICLETVLGVTGLGREFLGGLSYGWDAETGTRITRTGKEYVAGFRLGQELRAE